MIQSDSASSTFRKQLRPSMVSSSNTAPDLASVLRTSRRSVAPAARSSIVLTGVPAFMLPSMHPGWPRIEPRHHPSAGLRTGLGDEDVQQLTGVGMTHGADELAARDDATALEHVDDAVLDRVGRLSLVGEHQRTGRVHQSVEHLGALPQLNDLHLGVAAPARTDDTRPDLLAHLATLSSWCRRGETRLRTADAGRAPGRPGGPARVRVSPGRSGPAPSP